MKYIRKNIRVEATQFHYTALELDHIPWKAGEKTGDTFKGYPVWIDPQGPHLRIVTLKNLLGDPKTTETRVNVSDWLVEDITGEVFVLSNEEFQNTFQVGE